MDFILLFQNFNQFMKKTKIKREKLFSHGKKYLEHGAIFETYFRPSVLNYFKSKLYLVLAVENCFQEES